MIYQDLFFLSTCSFRVRDIKGNNFYTLPYFLLNKCPLNTSYIEGTRAARMNRIQSIPSGSIPALTDSPLINCVILRTSIIEEHAKYFWS